MKNFLTYILFSLLSVFNYAQWLPEFQLTTDPSSSYLSYNNAHCIAVNGTVIHVTWWDGRDMDREIYYNRSTNNGVTWQQDTRLTNSNGWSEYPSIAISGSHVHIIWMDDRDESFHPEVYYKRSTDGGINWGEDTRLTFDPSEPGIPSIAVSGSDIHIVWHDIREGNWEIYYKRSTDDGLTWQSDLRLTDNSAVSERASIAVSGLSTDEVYVVWQDERDADKEIYFKKSSDRGSTWSEDIRLTNSVGESEAPCIAAEDSLLSITWSDSRNGIGNGEVYYKQSTDAGLNWSEDIRVTNTPDNSGRASIAVSGNFVHVTWNEVWEIYYSRSTDYGITWETETRITNNPAHSENSFIVASDSSIHLIWQDKMAGNEDIYYKQNPTGNIITSIKNISMDNPSSFELVQNYPNPFNPTTTIRYSVADAYYASGVPVHLAVYDILGNEIAILVNEYKPAGSYEVEFQPTVGSRQMASGIYFYQLRAGKYIQTKKMLMIK